MAAVAPSVPSVTPAAAAEPNAPASPPPEPKLVRGARRPSLTSHLYLFLYNCFATAAWGYVFFHFLRFCLEKSSLLAWSSSAPALYRAIEGPLIVAQTMQAMEILHAVVGIVHSGVVTTFMQVFSRLQLVLFLFRYVPISYNTVAFFNLIGAWCLAELLRYPFFAAQELLQCIYFAETKKAFGDEGALAAVKVKTEVPMVLRWLRYSGFTFLYPLGITSEVLCMLNGLSTLQLPLFAHYPVPMPNMLNFEVNLHFIYILILLACIPGSFLLYNHMLQQRKKNLYGVGVEEKKTQ
ncbi:protein tyrosine phosphatase family protein, ptpla protein [Besnoitia besnoiti]|uniref:very-long-chain (3R)-3-hydroxyacyl-CoA dehydratase n=1 Tax=Besnoitia besnoiti TaxID=94643 RepID=A0A2A9MDU8_BESBE|nr:protein tyrosine phosphatase family protein, ptpla protein [Besnoitia besnoiti]PFH34126.1 protein tyrosine phosphatase family protein, ptpla protein [Besnoitia besnoiti]